MTIEISNRLLEFGNQPLSYGLILALLRDYKNPNDKVHHMITQGILQPVRKGLYIAGPSLKAGAPEPFLLANHITGPSYVTADSALSFYGLIPERVFTVLSATVKSSRKFLTTVGNFSYRHLPLPYYAFGVTSVQLSPGQQALLASPEKALFDKIIFTSQLKIRSRKAALHFLVEDLRMEEEELKKMDLNKISDWLADAPRKESLGHVTKAIKWLQ